MPIDFHVRSDNNSLEEFKRYLGDLSRNHPRAVLEAGAKEFVEVIRDSDPPESNAHRKQPPKTEKQRRYLFWAIKRGVIQVPRERTGALSAGWEAEAEADDRFRVRNRRSYSSWVQGGRRTRYHKATGWLTPREIYARRGESVRAAMCKEQFRLWSRRR